MAEHAGPASYVKIWVVLLILLGVSIAGPTLEIQVVTMITAFGVALVKAYLVAKHFMHVNLQPRYVLYVLCTCLTLMLVFWAGTAPDIYKDEGANWVKHGVSP
ncbi:MAG TPA: cytochrome C oxidase subunit IV family protein, partial [Candidatus Latescibacteria bacterium]|nr:cytochrome C oxidase subunit IV family protein [Candidatus Latescibacterota bacterium]